MQDAGRRMQDKESDASTIRRPASCDLHPASPRFFRNRSFTPFVFHAEPSHTMPYTGIVLALVGVHAAVFLVLLGHWAAAAGMFPQATRAFAEVYDRRPLRATLLGILTYGPLFFLFLQNGRLAGSPFRFVAVTAGIAALLIAFIGSAGLALRIGRNLSAGAETWPQILRGGVMLALVFITPFLGSLFVLHIGLASGFGAFWLARPWRSSDAPAIPATVPPPIPAVPVLS